MWQTLSILAMLVLGATAYFGYENQGLLKEQIEKRRSVNKSLQVKKAEIVKSEEDYQIANKDKDQTNSNNDKKKQELNDLLAKNAESKAAIDSKQQELTSKTNKLEEIKKLVAGLPDIDQIRPKIDSLRKELNGLESEIKDLESQMAQLNSERTQTTAAIQRYRQKDEDQRNSQSPEGFESRLSGVYQNFGFVIIGAGYNRGVVPGSMLEVVRSGEVVAQLKVKSVEESKSAADIVIKHGEEAVALRVGDAVRSVRVAAPAPAAVTEKAEPKNEAAEKPVEEDVVEDPFPAEDEAKTEEPAAGEETKEEGDLPTE